MQSFTNSFSFSVTKGWAKTHLWIDEPRREANAVFVCDEGVVVFAWSVCLPRVERVCVCVLEGERDGERWREMEREGERWREIEGKKKKKEREISCCTLLQNQHDTRCNAIANRFVQLNPVFMWHCGAWELCVCVKMVVNVTLSLSLSLSLSVCLPLCLCLPLSVSVFLCPSRCDFFCRFGWLLLCFGFQLLLRSQFHTTCQARISKRFQRCGC